MSKYQLLEEAVQDFAERVKSKPVEDFEDVWIRYWCGKDNDLRSSLLGVLRLYSLGRPVLPDATPSEAASRPAIETAANHSSWALGFSVIAGPVAFFLWFLRAPVWLWAPVALAVAGGVAYQLVSRWLRFLWPRLIISTGLSSIALSSAFAIRVYASASAARQQQLVGEQAKIFDLTYGATEPWQVTVAGLLTGVVMVAIGILYHVWLTRREAA